MMYEYENVITITLTFIGLAITLFAQTWIDSTYSKYKKIGNKHSMTGKDVARKILDKNGLKHIQVVETSGNLTDHYDPSSEVIRLSTNIYEETTIAAMAVAAHECGHAIQDKDDYKFMKIRSALVPIVNFVNYTGYFVIAISLLAGVTGYLILGIITVLATLVFQLVTLPVEFDASRRALEELEINQLVSEEEKEGVTNMLKAAAFTYVAGVLSGLLNLIRLILMLLDRKRDD